MPEFTVRTAVSSPYGRAVMATLEEKGVDWALKEMRMGDNKQESYLALHPFGRLPVLQHDEFTIYETAAILRYLDRILPTPPLTPTEPQEAARMDQLIGIADNYLFPECSKFIVFQRLIAPAVLGMPTNEAAVSGAMPRAHVAFGEISRILGGKDYLTGSTISLADVMIGTQLSLFSYTPEWGELTADHANLVEWLQRLEERPSFEKTRWEGLPAKN